jgi:hypothetical protein
LEDVDEDFIVYPADDSGVWNETILNVFFFVPGNVFQKTCWIVTWPSVADIVCRHDLTFIAIR